MENVLQFLKELAKNNNREWFQENKKWYDESRGKIQFLTDVLINEIRKFDTSIPPLNPSDCLFRIFRDVRFSHDKSPYKTNFGSFIAKGGKKAVYAGYYIHIEPEASFAGGGIYMPEGETLKAIRNHIAENGDEFLSLINSSGFKAVYTEMFDDKLKTAPKGFAPDHEYIEMLKYKSFAFTHKFNDEDVVGKNFIGNIVHAHKQLHMVNQFLNAALEK